MLLQDYKKDDLKMIISIIVIIGTIASRFLFDIPYALGMALVMVAFAILLHTSQK